jgi:ubiquinone/menaquinone biosynthesis C-methylase UbiE
MTDVSTTVQDNYTRGNLLERIFAFLKEGGKDPDKMKQEDLYPFDQLHGRGIASTREHIEFADISSGMHVLDLGCGIGGASRQIASSCDCRVTGVDLTQEFIDTAKELTKRCGLTDRIEFQQANALDLPFEDESFDHVWSHNVTMNIEDKISLAGEVARVLKPGGRFSCAEIGQGPAGEPSYPLPWASDSSSSFLATPEGMQSALEAGGLHVVKQIDLTEINVASQKEMREHAERGELPSQANQVVMGDDFPQRAQNSGKMMREGRLVEHMIMAEKS